MVILLAMQQSGIWVPEAIGIGPDGKLIVHAWRARLEPLPVELVVARGCGGWRWAVRLPMARDPLVMRACDSEDEGKALALENAAHLMRETLVRSSGPVTEGDALRDQLVDLLGLRARDPKDDRSNHALLAALQRVTVYVLSFIAPTRTGALVGANVLLGKIRSDLSTLPPDLFRTERQGALH